MTYYTDPLVTLLLGDCLEVMQTMPANSVDAVVTDPPYGLEFMGKEWDRLDAGLPQENVWKGRRGKGGANVGTDDSKPASRHHVSFAGKKSPGKRCTKCGKRSFSGSPCVCPDPDWVLEYTDGAPSSMIRMQRWHEAWAREAFRLLKPGGHLLAFGGTRTYHRLASAIEDAGFEIRDTLVWAYASGFPKSLDVGKVLPDWKGWGTALKPAYEPIVLARKPLIGSVARNVAEWGTGGLNIDGTRIGGGEERTIKNYAGNNPQPTGASGLSRVGDEYDSRSTTAGRWPANVILTDPIFDGGVEGVVGGGETAGAHGGNGEYRQHSWMSKFDDPRVTGSLDGAILTPQNIERSEGTYSRFFLIPKAARAERERGLAGATERVGTNGVNRPMRVCVECGRMKGGAAGNCQCGPTDIVEKPLSARANVHPTVKPINLMRHLVRLVTPPGGTVLDPFLGSGTTAIAAEMEGFGWIGIEREPEYVAIAEARLNGVQRGLGLDTPLTSPTKARARETEGRDLSSNRQDELIWKSYQP